MGLTWRDGVTSVLAAAVVAIGLAVTNDWGWPLLGSARAGSLAMGFIGIAMCATAGSGRDPEVGMKDRGDRVLAALGGLSLALVILGVITGSDAVFVALVVVTVGMWLMSTMRHAVASFAGGHAHHAARA